MDLDTINGRMRNTLVIGRVTLRRDSVCSKVKTSTFMDTTDETSQMD